MHRKVIQVAGSVLLISLPAEFHKSNDIRKGDELDVSLEDGALVIRLSKEIIERNQKKLNDPVPFD